MKKIRLTLDCFLAALFLTCAFPTSGQVATGTPPFGSYGGGPDTINLANLNAHIDVPVLQKAGRGMSFTYDLIYDSSVWSPVSVGSTKTWQPTTNWGWGVSTQLEIGYMNVNIDVTECGFYKNGIWINEGYIYYYSPWAYVDMYGQSHPFSGETIQYAGRNGYCPGQNTSLNAVTTDGSGYTLQATGGSATIIARNGTISVPPINSLSGSATKTDRNGNQISVSSSSVFTDTLGTTALTVSGTAPSPMTFTYTAPSGANASYTMKYTTYTVQTNFGCSGVGDYLASNIPLVSEIDLPDGTKYLFSYETTYQHSPNVTGRVASITLPTGGTISYTYGTGGVNGITCADGSASTLNRTTPDGLWTYAHSESGTAWTTLITDPQGNQKNMNFQGIYRTQSQVYQGSVSSGTLLKTVYTCYNGNVPNCNSTSVSLPITEKTVDVQWPGSSNKYSRVNTLYNSYGLVTGVVEYDYGNGAPPSTPLRQKVIAYASLGNNIVGLPSSVTVYDGNSNIKAQTTYTYDQGSVTATSGTPQHVSVSGSRGNATSVAYLVSGSTTLNKAYTYYDTGNLNTATDVNNAVTTYNYGTGSCGNSFVISVSEPVSLSRSMAWSCSGGVEVSVTDENGKTASTSYTDPYFWRPASTTDAGSNITSFTYTGATEVESAMPINGSSSSSDVLLTLDSLGRQHLSQRKESPNSLTYDSIETDYDADGRVDRTTLPYAGNAGQTSSTAPGMSTVYDALGRKTQTTDSGGGSVTFSYSQNDTYQTVGPAPTGEHTKQKQFEYDALGRLASVCEVTTLTGSGTCGQTTAATGYWTKYTYDVLDDLTNVTQNAQSGSSQTRSYTYDGLGRMTSETNPETGTTAYVYDYDPTGNCNWPSASYYGTIFTGNYPGDLVKKTDSVGNTICNQYDSLHRLTGTITPYGSYYCARGAGSPCTSPDKYFVYDSATVNGVAMSNAKGRLAEAYTCAGACSSKITDIGLSYTVLGQVNDVYESTPHSSGYYHVTEGFWANGALQQLSNLAGLPTLTYAVDGEGRVYSVSASSGQNPLTSTSYNVASLPNQVNLGSSDSDSYTFDQNTNRMTQYKFNVNGQSVVGAPTWNPIGTLKSLVVTDPFYSGDNQTCSYAHDDLTRIATANCGSPWLQTFTYDPFGNLSKSGSSSFQPTYSYLTNHMTQIGSSTPTYDANGNVTNDFLHTYAWDAYGRPVTVDGVGLTYDAMGRMVEQNRSGVYTEIVYGPGGHRLALMSGQTLQKAFIPLTGGAVAVYNSSGLAYYRHSDWLGSSRFASTSSRTMYSDGAYAPFGEAYAQSGTTDVSFTGMHQDTVTNLYDFPAREYGIQGRWPSPDPAGLAAASLANPQSLNRYAYVNNSPASLTDPTGLCPYWGAFVPGGKVICTSAHGKDSNFFGSQVWSGTNGPFSSPFADPNNPIYSQQPSAGPPDGLQSLDPAQGGVNGSSTTTCDQSQCSNQTMVIVNSNDAATSGDPNASPCYANDAACNAQLNQILCDGPCISSSGQAIGSQIGKMVTSQGIFELYGFSVVAGSGAAVYNGVSASLDALYYWGAANPQAVIAATQFLQGLVSTPNFGGNWGPSNALGRITHGLINSPSDTDPNQIP
jgi:RHS repeat-associated protein